MKQLFRRILAFSFLIGVTFLGQTSVCSARGSENKTDTIRLSVKLANRYIFSNTDSSVKYARKAFLLAKVNKSERSEADADYLFAGNYWIIGEYNKALQSALESLRIYEKLGDKKNMSNAYRAMASIYRDQGDFNNALKYAYKCKALAENIYPAIIYTIIGSIYEKSNQLDSALVYANKANEKDFNGNSKSTYGYIFLVYGNIYAKRADYAIATWIVSNKV
jgi:tetratricopeptide (TPR) repeat protein